MSSIFILKPIIDKLHEEMGEYNKKTEDYTVKIAKQSQEIDEKNRLIAKLSTECKKLESLISGYEANFDLLVSSERTLEDTSEHVPSSRREETSREPQANREHQVPREPHREPQSPRERATNDSKQCKQGTEVKVKKDRKDYMREYQRNYRKKQKEVTLSM